MQLLSCSVCSPCVSLTHASCATPLSFNILVTHQRSHSRLAVVRISNLDSSTDVFFFSAFLPLSSPRRSSALRQPPASLGACWFCLTCTLSRVCSWHCSVLCVCARGYTSVEERWAQWERSAAGPRQLRRLRTGTCGGMEWGLDGGMGRGRSGERGERVAWCRATALTRTSWRRRRSAKMPQSEECSLCPSPVREQLISFYFLFLFYFCRVFSCWSFYRRWSLIPPVPLWWRLWLLHTFCLCKKSLNRFIPLKSNPA